jgi:hypothetical protein
MRKRLAKQLITMLFRFNDPRDMLLSLKEFASEMEDRALARNKPSIGWEKIAQHLDRARADAQTFYVPWKSMFRKPRR